MKHKAMVIWTSDSPRGMHLSNMPTPNVGPRQVRVSVAVAGVNPVDASNRADSVWANLEAPYVVGYEFAGHIAECGDLVTEFENGDRVWGLLPVRGTRWGSYAEQIVVDASFVAMSPAELTDVEAGVLPLAGSTALQLLHRLDPQPGEAILVHGAAGGVGHIFVQLCLTRGVKVVAPVRPSRVALLRRLGVEFLVDRSSPDVIGAARDMNGEDFAVVADFVGAGCLLASLEVMAVGGRAGSIVEIIGDLELAVDQNLTIHGVLVEPSTSVLDELANFVKRGELRPIVDQTFSLSDAADAHRRIETGSGQGKVALLIS